MFIDLSTLSPNRVYFTLIQTIIPRPIAWVLSDNGTGAAQRYNLAPFSYFNAVCSDPPLLMVSIGKKPDGSIKDTRRNILERGKFVVHIAHSGQVDAVNASSADLPAGTSELDALGLETVAFGDFPLPRLRDARVAFACERYQVMEVGEQAIVFGLVRSAYIDDSIAVADAQGRLQIDALGLDPLSRLGGDQYGVLGQVVTRRRPR
jgi:flavin reductase (DIM6/NTAB) family NADH-FMN oxidoreductase RutF